MIYKLASHIHLQGHHTGFKKVSIKDVLDFYSDYDIIALTVHRSNITKKFYSLFVKECKKYSTSKKLILPCLEDENNQFHLLLIGALSYPKKGYDPNKEYLTILAHPFGYGYHKRKIPKKNVLLKELDGIEVWNLYHNSKKYPPLRTFKFFKKFPDNIKAYIGMDEHPPFKKTDTVTFINCKNLKKKSVIRALKGGMFYSQLKDFTITSEGELKKDKKILSTSIKINCLIHELIISLLSFSTYIGNKILNLLNIGKREKNKIEKFVNRFRKKL